MNHSHYYPELQKAKKQKKYEAIGFILFMALFLIPLAAVGLSLNPLK